MNKNIIADQFYIYEENSLFFHRTGPEVIQRTLSLENKSSYGFFHSTDSDRSCVSAAVYCHKNYNSDMFPQMHALWAVCSRKQTCLVLADTGQEVERFPYKVNVNCRLNWLRRAGSSEVGKASSWDASWYIYLYMMPSGYISPVSPKKGKTLSRSLTAVQRLEEMTAAVI